MCVICVVSLISVVVLQLAASANSVRRVCFEKCTCVDRTRTVLCPDEQDIIRQRPELEYRKYILILSNVKVPGNLNILRSFFKKVLYKSELIAPPMISNAQNAKTHTTEALLPYLKAILSFFVLAFLAIGGYIGFKKRSVLFGLITIKLRRKTTTRIDDDRATRQKSNTELQSRAGIGNESERISPVGTRHCAFNVSDFLTPLPQASADHLFATPSFDSVTENDMLWSILHFCIIVLLQF